MKAMIRATGGEWNDVSGCRYCGESRIYSIVRYQGGLNSARSTHGKAVSTLPSPGDSLDSANQKPSDAESKPFPPDADLSGALREPEEQQANLASSDRQATYYPGLVMNLRGVTVKYCPVASDIFTAGAGYLDIAAAVQKKSAVAPKNKSMRTHAAYYDAATQSVITTSDLRSVGHQSTVWGTTASGHENPRQYSVGTPA